MRFTFPQSYLLVALTAAVAATQCCEAFIPGSNRFTGVGTDSGNKWRGSTIVFASRSFPPPPPPPPPQVPESNDVFSDLFQKLQGSIKPESTTANFPSLKFPHISTPQLELPESSDLFRFDIDNVFTSVDLAGLTAPMQQAKQYLSALGPQLSEKYPELVPAYQSFWNTLEHSLENYPYAAPAIAIVSALLVQSLENPFSQDTGPQVPYPTGRYDPVTAKAYFDRRPGLVLARGLLVVTRSLSFAARVLGDYVKERNGEVIPAEVSEQRGRELATLLCQLGSTYIKVGQSLSIRTDLLSPPYIRGLQSLQDQVPPFDSDKAFEMIEEEWGQPLNKIVSVITPVPVASASLGQVYKGTLKDGGVEVAIKVQRPDIMEQIALDMYLLREYIAPTAKKLGNLNSDTVGTVDAWGLGFVDELNYIQEAENAEFFTEEISKTPLKDVVFSPKVVTEYSTRKVLVTEWVDGERLDKSSQTDVTNLCSIAMNTYLTMLLEIGVLHCDPHPGNLLRTPEGRLAILDWGMITRIDSSIQLTLIEHMAHLTSADYEEIPRDLLLLGFIPESKAHLINDSEIVALLADIYGKWAAGGGAANINVNEVVVQLQELTAKKGNLFQIPPYFAYIAKSFSVLEGIGLTNNAKYSIIDDCLPYVSKRLLTDSDSMKSALNTFIFGPEKNSEYRIVDYKRVEQLVAGFGNYSTSASGALMGKGELSRKQLLESTTDQILDLVFTEEETPLQEILLEQLAKITAASGRSLFTQLRDRSGYLPNGRTVLGTLVDPMGLWRTSPLVRMNELDEKIVDTTRKLLLLAQNQAQASGLSQLDLDPRSLTPDEVVEVSSMLVRKVWDKRRGVLQTGSRFARKLLELTAAKLERGERDTRRLPIKSSSPGKDNKKTYPNKSPKGLLEPATDRVPRTSPVALVRPAMNKPAETSTRLQEARQLLNRLQSEDED